MLKSTFLSIGFLALTAGSVHAADGVPAFLACKWDEGRLPSYLGSTMTGSAGATQKYRITPTSWMWWNSSAWKWEEQPCVEMHGTQVRCSVTVSDDEYRWHQSYDVDEPAISHTDTMTVSLAVDRQSAVSTWVWYSRSIFGTLGKDKTERGENQGTCQSIEDPSTKPKPAPKL